MHPIEFILKDSDGKVIVNMGYLPWPREVRRISVDGDLVEVLERTGTRAIFSLEDIMLHDLFHYSEGPTT